MSSNLQNSIWPNTDGNLGNIKVQIPDGVTTPWPTGDALIGNFVYHKGKLVGFVDTKALIANSSKTTTFPYEYVNISLPSIAEGEMTYNHDQCTYIILNDEVIKFPVYDDLDIITNKYKGCTTVNSVRAVDPSFVTNDIVDGAWTEGLRDLEDGYNMFYGCGRLNSFSSDLSNLTSGVQMFYGCYNLESFTAKLSKLTSGVQMFGNCRLDTASVQHIADTINTVSSGTFHIGIGHSSPNEEEKAALNTMVAKGWTVFIGAGPPWGHPSYNTIDGEEEQTPIPFWAKPVPSDEEHAQYVDEQGNFFNILGGNYIYGDNLETYGMFTCEEDAAANMRLTKIEK